jgi:ACR3 family arsenite efflux pump ArsB
MVCAIPPALTCRHINNQTTTVTGVSNHLLLAVAAAVATGGNELSLFIL